MLSLSVDLTVDHSLTLACTRAPIYCPHLPQALVEKSKSLTGVEQWPFRAVAAALEVVPRTLAQNCGADTVRLMTQLRAAKQGASGVGWANVE